jgi:hypothetical protein
MSKMRIGRAGFLLLRVATGCMWLLPRKPYYRAQGYQTANFPRIEDIGDVTNADHPVASSGSVQPSSVAGCRIGHQFYRHDIIAFFSPSMLCGWLL